MGAANGCSSQDASAKALGETKLLGPVIIIIIYCDKSWSPKPQWISLNCKSFSLYSL